jgi:hypothetical protein
MQILKIGGNIYRVVRRLEPDDFSDLKSFAPVIATPKRLKGERVTDDRLWSDVEKQYAELSEDVQREIERADRRIYDIRRIERPSGASGPSGRRINNRPTGGHFVAIDSEGVTIGYKKIAKKVKGKIETTEKFDQRTVLWMAGGAEDYAILKIRRALVFILRKYLSICYHCRRNMQRQTLEENNRYLFLLGLVMM